MHIEMKRSKKQVTRRFVRLSFFLSTIHEQKYTLHQHKNTMKSFGWEQIWRLRFFTNTNNVQKISCRCIRKKTACQRFSYKSCASSTQVVAVQRNRPEKMNENTQTYNKGIYNRHIQTHVHVQREPFKDDNRT